MGIDITHSTATATTTAAEVLAARVNRMELEVENKGAVVVYLRVDGGVVTSATGIALAPGATRRWVHPCPKGAVTALAASTTAALLILEG